MSKTKKIRRKKFNILKFLVFILFLYILISAFFKILNVPIKNILILKNNYLSDEKIIEVSLLDNYPSFIKTTSYNIKKRIKKLPLVEDVKVSKKFGYRVVIEVTEKKILYMSRSDNMFVVSSGEKLELNNISGVPILINFVPEDIEQKLINKMKNLSINSISKISEIEYSPTSYDDERFIFYMNDSNLVYINLSSINKINKYNEIVTKLEGHNGILYLDSGNYFEIKE
ncbi:MAG: FtsQ-type POTRA domain-containing protein [Bacilli bacterium]|nr:FtsQ-type POTRA domain-containing protein [Bacilli bacterium]